MRNLKKYSNHSGYTSAPEEPDKNKVSICKSENHTHYDKKIYDAEIEYLESSGTQWIDTEVSVTDSTTWSCTYIKESTTAPLLFAMVSGNYSFSLGSNGRFRIGADNSQLGINTAGEHTVAFDGNTTITLDGVVKKSNLNKGTVNSEYSLVIFGERHPSNPNTVYDLSSAKICNLKVGNIRDLIPVRKGQVGYMYDRVSKRLFGNSGTGTFTLGPDV